MPCRQCTGIEQFFDQREASRELRGYRRKGPARTTRMLLDALKSLGVEERTVLDIGGGIGAIQHDLLKFGASRSLGVEASRAYVDAAKEEARSQGLGDREAYRHGDFVSMAPDIEQLDIVTLDRVICCFDDVENLVGLSSEKAGHLYGVVYPRDNWFLRAAFRVFNLLLWLRRSQFRVFIHPTDKVEALVSRNGLERRFYAKTAIWQVAVYVR